MSRSTPVRRAVLLVVSLLFGCGEQKGEKLPVDSTAAAEMAAMPGMGNADSAATVILTAAQVSHGAVVWGNPTLEPMAASVTIPGEVVVNEDRTARLGAPARGRVVTVHVSAGDLVARGTALVTLESSEASAAAAELAKAEASLISQRAEAVFAASARARAERLLALTAIPRQEYERAVANDSLAQSMLRQAVSERRRAQEGAKAMGVDASGSGAMVIRSPLAGVVLLRSAVPGAVVEAGAPLVTVTDLTRLWVTASAPEALGGARRGAAVRFTVAAFPADTFRGRLEAVGPGLDPATRTLPLRVAVDNRDGKLRPEMLATVMVDGGRATEMTVVPDAAVQLLDGGPVVFVVTPDGKGGGSFVARTVTVLSRAGGKIAIGVGVDARDLVVLQGSFAVKAELQKRKQPAMEM